MSSGSGSGCARFGARRGWTQARLAARRSVSRAAIWRIERGRADRVAVHVLVRVAAALGARVDVRLLWQGEGLDRLLDAGHADLVDRTLELLSASDWLVATEVSFNIRGERGSIDILAFHPATGSLLVIEVKSVVPDMQAMLHGDRSQGTARARHRARPRMAGDERHSAAGPSRRPHRAEAGGSMPRRFGRLFRRAPSRPPLDPTSRGHMHGVLFLSDAHQSSARHRVRSRGFDRREDPSVARERGPA